jgi:hypothetical protein
VRRNHKGYFHIAYIFNPTYILGLLFLLNAQCCDDLTTEAQIL